MDTAFGRRSVVARIGDALTHWETKGTYKGDYKELYMGYVTVQEMKRSADLWARLREQKELVVTRDGKPCAIMVDTDADTAEDSLREIRSALFAAAVSRVRRRAQSAPPSDQAIATAIRRSRTRRKKT